MGIEYVPIDKRLADRKGKMKRVTIWDYKKIMSEREKEAKELQKKESEGIKRRRQIKYGKT